MTQCKDKGEKFLVIGDINIPPALFNSQDDLKTIFEKYSKLKYERPFNDDQIEEIRNALDVSGCQVLPQVVLENGGKKSSHHGIVNTQLKTTSITLDTIAVLCSHSFGQSLICQRFYI